MQCGVYSCDMIIILLFTELPNKMVWLLLVINYADSSTCIYYLVCIFVAQSKEFCCCGLCSLEYKFMKYCSILPALRLQAMAKGAASVRKDNVQWLVFVAGVNASKFSLMFWDLLGVGSAHDIGLQNICCNYPQSLPNVQYCRLERFQITSIDQVVPAFIRQLRHVTFQPV